ncbi:hypothetical protein LIER_43641 [Lithospermum erythrorhizon]|uniref:Uncharacterized protein n=1 Tax=Lithospermum erythrorhizon TaxID=34254 RepID=A0AAV3QH81_LITER
MAESSKNPSSKPTIPSKVLERTLCEARLVRQVAEGPVNIKAYASIQTPALTSLYRRSAMEEALEDFVGSLLRDSLEAPPTTTSPDLDDSRAPLDVQPLCSRMGSPSDKARVSVSKSSKGKSSKEPPTLEEVKAKTIPALITDYQLRQIRKHYDIPDVVDTPSIKKDAPQ